MTEDEFRASEYNSLLKLQKEEEYSDEPAGTIVKQNPKAGRTVKEGQKITLTVSLGTQYITIPETKNMVAEDAEQTLKDMGLRVTKKPMVDATVAPRRGHLHPACCPVRPSPVTRWSSSTSAARTRTKPSLCPA